MQLPLEDVKILDLTHALAGPFCSTMLADFGAQVIKLEPPGAGDIARSWGVPMPGGETSYFVTLHRNKRGIVVDLKTPEGKELFFRLVEQCDVVLENYRVGALEKLGLGYEAARRRNPGIIYCSVSGFGQDGPYRERAALDLILQAESGMISVTGEPGTTGTRAGVSIADLTAGMYCAYGVMLALRTKEKTGEGQQVDISMLEGQLSLLGTAFANYFADGKVPAPMGTAYAVVVPYQTFHTRTRDLALAIAGEKLWRKFCPTIGCPELADDPRYRTTTDRMNNRDTLIPKLQEVFLTRTYEDWEALLLANDIPVGAINNIAQVIEHPQVKARKPFVEMDHPTAGKVRAVGTPVRLSKTPAQVRRPAPTHGQHTHEVLREVLGLSTDEIAALDAKGVLG
ncbi:MAG TPA: CoA transferase [Burkholderiales bacterium]|jgi:Predicted acyl-CoA transferases/carnitine dehydratase